MSGAARHLPFLPLVPLGGNGDDAAASQLFLKIDEGRLAEITKEDVEAAFGQGFDEFEGKEIASAVVSLLVERQFKLPPAPSISAAPIDGDTFRQIDLILQRRGFAIDRGDLALANRWTDELARVLRGTFLQRDTRRGGIARTAGITEIVVPIDRTDVDDLTRDRILELDAVERAKWEEQKKAADAYMGRINEAIAAEMKVKLRQQAPVFDEIIKIVEDIAGPTTEAIIQNADVILLVEVLANQVDLDPDGPRPEAVPQYVWDQYRALYASDGVMTRLALNMDRLSALLARHSGRTKIYNLIMRDLPAVTEAETGALQVQNEVGTEDGAGLLPLILIAQNLGSALTLAQTVEERLLVEEAIKEVRGQIDAVVEKIKAVPAEIEANPPKLAVWSRFVRSFSDFPPEVQEQVNVLFRGEKFIEALELSENEALITEGFIFFLSILAGIAVLRSVRGANVTPLPKGATIEPIRVRTPRQRLVENLPPQAIRRATALVDAVERAARGASANNRKPINLEMALQAFNELRGIALTGTTAELFEAMVVARASRIVEAGGISTTPRPIFEATGLGRVALDWALRLHMMGPIRVASRLPFLILDIANLAGTSSSIAKFTAAEGKPLPARDLPEAAAFLNRVKTNLRSAVPARGFRLSPQEVAEARFNLRSVVESAVTEGILRPVEPILSQGGLARLLAAVRAAGRAAGLSEKEIDRVFVDAFRNLGALRVFEQPLPDAPTLEPIELEIPVAPLFFRATNVPNPEGAGLILSPNVLPDPVFVADLSAAVGGAAAEAGTPLPAENAPAGAVVLAGVDAVVATRPTGADTAEITFRQVLGAPVSVALRGLLAPAGLVRALEEAMAYGAFHLTPQAVRAVAGELLEAFNLAGRMPADLGPVVVPVSVLAERFEATEAGQAEATAVDWAQVVARTFRLFELPADLPNLNGLLQAGVQGFNLVSIGAGANVRAKSEKMLTGMIAMASRLLTRRWLKESPLAIADPAAMQFVMQELFWTPALMVPGLQGVAMQLADASVRARAAWLRADAAARRGDAAGALLHSGRAAGLIEDYSRAVDQFRPTLDFPGWATLAGEDIGVLRSANAATVELAEAIAARRDAERALVRGFLDAPAPAGGVAAARARAERLVLDGSVTIEVEAELDAGPTTLELAGIDDEIVAAEAAKEEPLPPLPVQGVLPVGPPVPPPLPRVPMKPARAAQRS